jgi:FSR family fosmidomycin resistance protein-like MFS transporter
LSAERNLKTIFHRWGGGIAVFFSYTHLSHDLCAGLLTALLPLIRDSLGLSYLQSGLLLSAYTITSGLSQFPGGWIGDRLRRNIVIGVGLGGISLMAIAVGLSPAYYPMLFILVVMGIFAGAYHPSAVSLLSGYYDASKRGKVIALHMAGGSIGYAMGPILGGLIAEFFGWRFAFIILALPALSAAPLLLKKFRQQWPVTREPITDDNTTQQPIRRGLSIFQVLKPIAIIFILTVSMQLVAGSAMAFIPIYLVDKHNIAAGYAAMMLGIIRGAGIVGSLFGGWLSDRWGRKNAIFLTLVATGPVLYLLTILSFNAGLIIIFILFGLFMYMRQATVQPLLMDNVPAHLRATIFGIYFGLSMEGMSLVQPVAGHFMDIFGIVEVFTVIALMSVGLSLVALFLAKKA